MQMWQRQQEDGNEVNSGGNELKKRLCVIWLRYMTLYGGAVTSSLVLIRLSVILAFHQASEPWTMNQIVINFILSFLSDVLKSFML